MTREEIIKMPAGREMDALIAENVFGLKTYQSFGGGYMVKSGTVKNLDVSHYSTSISAAWEVVGKVRENLVTCKFYLIADTYGETRAVFDQILEDYEFEAKAETAQLAICRAALLSVMEDGK